MADLRAIAEAATPGPWVVQEPGPNEPWAGSRWIDSHGFVVGPVVVVAPDHMTTADDAAHIAAWSPDRTLAALDVIEAAKAVHAPEVSSRRWAELRLALEDWDALG